jgi:hypothetical protein
MAFASDDFIALALENPVNRAILERLPALGLADAWLVAGCLFQTAWNVRSGRPPGENIADYDLFYFDDRDLSWDAEDREIKRAAALFGDLGVKVELRNQARVHLWYGQRFGPGYPQLRSSRDGIDRFLICCTCVGIHPAAKGLELYAPYGLDELAQGILRPNPRNLRTDRFAEKAASYRTRWPWLTVAGDAGAA